MSSLLMSCPYDAHKPENTSRGSNVHLTLRRTFFLGGGGTYQKSL